MTPDDDDVPLRPWERFRAHLGTRFSDVERCPTCALYGERHMAPFTWIIGQPETYRMDCDRCRERGPQPLLLLKQIEKLVKRTLKDVRRVAHLLTPDERQRIADQMDEIIALLREGLHIISVSHPLTPAEKQRVADDVDEILAELRDPSA